jgi:hypothetical protein
MISGAIEHGRFSMACLGLSGPFPAPVRTPLDKVHGGSGVFGIDQHLAL